MSLQYHQLLPAWKSEVVQDFEELFLHAAHEAYRESHDYCLTKKLNARERLSFRPQIRWVLMEKALRDTAESVGLSFDSVANKPGTHYHCEVQSGVICLTQSHVADRDEMPQFAWFRESLAKSPQKVFQFEEDKVEQSPVDAKLYAILVHSEDRLRPWLPRFINVMFPVSATQVAGPSLKLMDIHAGIAETIQGLHVNDFAVEEIAAPEAPALLDPFINKTGTDDQ